MLRCFVGMLAVLLLLSGTCGPTPTKAWGAPPVTISAIGIDPVLTMTPSVGAAAVGANVGFTVSASVPTTETATARNCVVKIPWDSAKWQWVSGQAPELRPNGPATLDCDNDAGTAQPQIPSNVCYVRITGRTVAITPGANLATVPIGDLAPGNIVTITFTLKIL